MLAQWARWNPRLIDSRGFLFKVGSVIWQYFQIVRHVCFFLTFVKLFLESAIKAVCEK